MSYLAAFLAAQTPETPTVKTDKRVPHGASVSSGSDSPVRFESSSGLACREVLGFPAGLLADLPLPTSLVCKGADGSRCTLKATESEWQAMLAPLPTHATVAAVLAHHRLRLLAVVLSGGS